LELEDFLTPKNPLGPFRHERVLKRSEDEHTNILIYHAASFDGLIEEQRPIIIGRRGAGKTAIVAALLAKSGREENSTSRDSGQNRGKDVYAFINSWDHLDELVDKVGRDARHSLGPDNDWSSLLPETASRHWSRRLWMVIFQQLYRDTLSDRPLREKLPELVKYVQGRDISLKDEEITEEGLNRLFVEVRKSIIKYLEREGRKCYIVIDSLEQYPVTAPRFQKLIAGLLKCVNDFNDDFPRVHVLCCIPEEIEPFVAPKSSNRLKDLSSTTSVSRLRWRPIELLRIVAERYRAFLKIYAHEDTDFIRKIGKMDFSERAGLRNFYNLTLPHTVRNSLGRDEPTLAYIIRHTQMLPREFLMIFDAAITASYKIKGSWRFIESEAIVFAVESQEPDLADQILSPYEPIYPSLIEACRKVLPDLNPICTYNDLSKLSSRLRKLSGHEVDDPWEALFKIGVIGYVEDQDDQSKSASYEYGSFHFNSSRPITFANNRKYCVHPVFSGTWKLRRADTNLKCVYPANVEFDPWLTH
jgi:hypothetical protein